MSTRPGIEITANYSQVKVVTMAKHNSTLSIILPFQVNLRYGYIWSSLFSAVFVLWIFPAVFSTPFFFFFFFLFPAAGALLSQSSAAAKLNSQTKHRTRDEKLFMPP